MKYVPSIWFLIVTIIIYINMCLYIRICVYHKTLRFWVGDMAKKTLTKLLALEKIGVWGLLKISTGTRKHGIFHFASLTDD